MSDPLVYHIPALLPQVLDVLQVRPDGVYADATFGGGGHSRAIVGALGPEGRLYSFDQDEEAVANAWDDDRLTVIHGNFRFIAQYLRFYGVDGADGILADLGVSFHHFDDPGRGFSFRFSGPLDMRMNRRAGISAAQLLAESDEARLTEIFRLYGELRQASRMARAIVKARSEAPVDTVERLLEIVRPLINPKNEKKELAQLFQALRIVVNDEIAALRSFLVQALKALKPGGRLAVITYHSLEDRLVKNFMRTGNVEGRENKDFYGRNLSPLRLLNSK
ncbi:MAG: 16S rRNA (cytosine(1402)-N(4))-methyltransferase RsmH, partial [Muribaculaceae bacterium]|nr:16S rRNA (cytosine(1402)-N(4))-methyltransferase RsmH [Muribaculaceae bacterium]